MGEKFCNVEPLVATRATVQLANQSAEALVSLPMLGLVAAALVGAGRAAVYCDSEVDFIPPISPLAPCPPFRRYFAPFRTLTSHNTPNRGRWDP